MPYLSTCCEQVSDFESDGLFWVDRIARASFNKYWMRSRHQSGWKFKTILHQSGWKFKTSLIGDLLKLPFKVLEMIRNEIFQSLITYSPPSEKYFQIKSSGIFKFGKQKSPIEWSFLFQPFCIVAISMLCACLTGFTVPPLPNSTVNHTKN